MLADYDIALVRKNLIEFSYGDTEFIVDLIESMSENFDEFVVKFPVAIEESNSTDARFLVHKMKLTFQTCQLEEVESAAQRCARAIITEGKADQDLLKQLLAGCRLAQSEINKLKVEFTNK